MTLLKSQSDPILNTSAEAVILRVDLCRPTSLEIDQTIKVDCQDFERDIQDPEVEDLRTVGFLTSLNTFKKVQCISSCVNAIISYPLIFVCIWAVFYIFWNDTALPGGPLFALLSLEIFALLLGQLSDALGLPPFLGMLVAGFLLRNVSYINVGKDLPISISSPLRGVSVVILLTRGALTVNQKNIQKFVKVVPGLAMGSCLSEAISGGLAAYFIIGFPIEWAVFMGFIISAMSGAGLMPYLVKEENRWDAKRGLSPTASTKQVILIAKTACGLDAILAICLAKFSLGFIMCEASAVCGLSKGLLDVLIGGAFGILWGGLSGLILKTDHGNDLRSIAVFSGGVMSLLGLTKIGYPGGGPLGVFLSSLIASNTWRRGEGINNDRVNETFTKLWFVFQPLLFGILGARTNFEDVDWLIVAKGILCLAISLSTRLVASFALTHWSNLSIRERLFITIAWIPKGTVQAALGPIALDTAMQLQLGETFTTPAYQVMNITAAVIVTTSVLGPIVLKVFGPRLLSLKPPRAEMPCNGTQILLPTDITKFN